MRMKPIGWLVFFESPLPPGSAATGRGNEICRSNGSSLAQDKAYWVARGDRHARPHPNLKASSDAIQSSLGTLQTSVGSPALSANVSETAAPFEIRLGGETGC